MLRNEMAVWREYWRNEPLWVLRQLLSRIKSMLLMLIFEKERRSKLKFALLGLWDGLRGKSGRDASGAFCRFTLK
jgi:rhamnosyltransferase